MEDYKLLISIIPHDRGESLIRAAMESGCQGGTVMSGRALAKSNVAAILGLGEFSRDIVLMVVRNDVKESVSNAIVNASKTQKKASKNIVTKIKTKIKKILKKRLI